MASLQQLLTEEGFNEQKKLIRNQKKGKVKGRNPQEDSILLPILICNSQRSFPTQKQNRKSNNNASSCNGSSRRGGGGGGGGGSETQSGRSISGLGLPGKSEPSAPAVDEEVANTSKAVVSILSGYAGQYLRDKEFRESTRAKCYYSCFLRKNQDSDEGIFANLEMGIESVERLVENQGIKEELGRADSVQYSIRVLSFVATSMNSKCRKKGSTCGIKNSHLSACAQLYLSILYRIEKNGRSSARHLLQVFLDAPFLARMHFLPELWEHLFLPNLLHLKIWYSEQLDFLLESNRIDKDMKVKALEKAYHTQMDYGTKTFALYYKECLKVGGAHVPAVPHVPLPVLQNCTRSRRYSDSYVSHSSNEFLSGAVFGTIQESSRAEEDLSYRWSLQDLGFSTNRDMAEHSSHEGKSSLSCGRRFRTDLWPDNQKLDHFDHLNSRSDRLVECSVHIVPGASVGEDTHGWKNDLHRAIEIISLSDTISECEMAVRIIAKSWLDSPGNPILETMSSNAQVIQGILQVLSASNDDEILELLISILAQIVTKKVSVESILLNLDPQLDIFLKLLRNNNLFLKAAALLYLMKPGAKQMIAVDWIPLVLRVLEFGDQLQTLFSIQICPQKVAYYFFDQLLTCFDEDKNMENARHIVSLGGLKLLRRRLEIGDIYEKNKVVSIISCCIRAERSCRHYVAKHLNKESLISLLLPKNLRVSQGHAFALLTEIFCLHRHQQRTEFLNELKHGRSSLNTMHVLLVYLHRAQPEERPLVAAILLQLDLLGDLCECSAYREEVVEEIVKALNCEVLNEKVQEQAAKALLILGGHFSYTGEPVTEKWLLKEAGFDHNPWESFGGHKVADSSYVHLIRDDDDEETETWWRRKTTTVLLQSGNKRFLNAISESIENGIPCLARASLVTISWISQSMGKEKHLQSLLAGSALVPQLLEGLGQDKTMEERVLASFSLLNLLKGSGHHPYMLSWLNNELVDATLRDLSQVTWTAKELISIITSC